MLAPKYWVSPERVDKKKRGVCAYTIINVCSWPGGIIHQPLGQMSLNLVYSFYKPHTEIQALEHISR